MIKKFICLILLGFSFFTANSMTLDKSNVRYSSHLGKLKVVHEHGSFKVLKDGQEYEVQNAFVDKEVRSLTDLQLAYFLGNIIDVNVGERPFTLYKVSRKQYDLLNLGKFPRVDVNKEAMEQMAYEFNKANYISVHQLETGEFMIKSHVRGLGGGPLGFLIGGLAAKFTVHFVAQVGIAIATGGVAIICPPAAGPFYVAAQATVTPLVEGISTTAAMIGGLAGAVATGPA